MKSIFIALVLSALFVSLTGKKKRPEGGQTGFSGCGEIRLNKDAYWGKEKSYGKSRNFEQFCIQTFIRLF